MPGLDSEAIDFRAASESFAPFRKLARRDLETLRLVTDHKGRKVPTVGGMILHIVDRTEIEAKPVGYKLFNVEIQIDKYATGLPAGLNPPVQPLPFLYLSTGIETRFINGLDPDPKTRPLSSNLPQIHRPETLTEWIDAETLDQWVKRLHAEGSGFYTGADDPKPSSLRARPQKRLGPENQPNSTPGSEWLVFRT